MAKTNKEKKLSKKEQRELAEVQMDIDRVEFSNKMKNGKEDEIVIPVPPKHLAEEVFKVILGVILFILLVVFFGLLAWYFLLQSDTQLINGLPQQTTQQTEQVQQTNPPVME